MLKKHRNKIIAAAAVLLVLTIAFLQGGGMSLVRRSDDSAAPAATQKVKKPKATPHGSTDLPSEEQTPESSEPVLQTDEEGNSEEYDMSDMTAEEKIEAASQIAEEVYGEDYEEYIESVQDTDEYISMPAPVDVPKSADKDKKLTCALSVRCDTVLKNIDKLDKAKAKIVPENGVIFESHEVEFYDGESVFNVLLREMKRNKIHFEFVNTPIYGSAYIEGIANLYEFDCGELSGWLYKVNGVFPNYGCSRYALKDGDVIEVVYTCDLGVDVGGYFAAGGRLQYE